MNRSTNLYMHTINGKPAVYVPGQQIVFFNKYNRVAFAEVFVESLQTIRRQQEASRQWRAAQGYNLELPGGYGYIRIKKKGLK